MPPTLMRSSSRYFPNGTGCLTRSNGSGRSAEITVKKGGRCPGSATTVRVFFHGAWSVAHGPATTGGDVGAQPPGNLVRRRRGKPAALPRDSRSRVCVRLCSAVFGSILRVLRPARGPVHRADRARERRRGIEERVVRRRGARGQRGGAGHRLEVGRH